MHASFLNVSFSRYSVKFGWANNIEQYNAAVWKPVATISGACNAAFAAVYIEAYKFYGIFFSGELQNWPRNYKNFLWRQVFCLGTFIFKKQEQDSLTSFIFSEWWTELHLWIIFHLPLFILSARRHSKKVLQLGSNLDQLESPYKLLLS